MARTDVDTAAGGTGTGTHPGWENASIHRAYKPFVNTTCPVMHFSIIMGRL